MAIHRRLRRQYPLGIGLYLSTLQPMAPGPFHPAFGALLPSPARWMEFLEESLLACEGQRRQF